MSDESASAPNEEQIADPGEVTDAQVEDSSPSEEVEEQQPKKKPWFNERIDELTANWRRTERELEAERSERQRLYDLLEKSQQPQQMQQTSSGEPKLDDFATYDEYVSAMIDYKAEAKIQAWEAQQTEKQTKAESQRLAQEFTVREREFASSVQDYDQVAHDPYLPVSDSMAEVIRTSENGPELLYQLGKQPEEAARIANMSPTLAAMEMGKFAAKLAMPQAKLNSAAPDPIEPISGGDEGVVTDPSRAKDMGTYVKLRRQQMEK